MTTPSSLAAGEWLGMNRRDSPQVGAHVSGKPPMCVTHCSVQSVCLFPKVSEGRSTRRRADPGVERFHFPFESKATTNLFAALSPHTERVPGLVEESTQGAGQRDRRVRRDQSARLAVRHQFRNGSKRGGDDRHPARQRLHQDSRQAVAVAIRRQSARGDKNIVLAEGPVHFMIRLCTTECDMTLNPEPPSVLRESVSTGAVADDIATKRPPPVSKKGTGIKKRVEPFLLHQTPHSQQSPDRRD
ncbi:hypothetical protein GGQ11_000280 [Salinibacter ruber]|nr:hypothetical protein [Salinibacter ruber]